MKKLYKYILRSFIGTFVFTFFIAVFILLMQFLWTYLDDLVGKGIGFDVLGKLMFYTAARLSGQEAKEFGLVQKVCKPEELRVLDPVGKD